MVTGDLFFILWIVASIRIMWLLCKLWVHGLYEADDAYWDACVHPGSNH
jgi:hypothetical protein